MTIDDSLRIRDTAHNHVVLRGRVSGEVEVRVLPSGDELVSLRLVVPRDRAARRRSRQSVDTFECVAWTAAARRQARRLSTGEHVEVLGQLRRRFRRDAGGARSWITVEAGRFRRLPSPQ